MRKNTGHAGGRTKRGNGGSAPLKNYTSTANITNILDAIRRTLAENGARRINFEYDGAGEPREISFSLLIDEHLASFRLPARLYNVQPLIIESYRKAGRSAPRGEALKEQAARTGWANIRDWLSAQMALIRTGMVKPHEVFLPYLLIEGIEEPMTYYEAFERYHALPAPQTQVSIREVGS